MLLHNMNAFIRYNIIVTETLSVVLFSCGCYRRTRSRCAWVRVMQSCVWHWILHKAPVDVSLNSLQVLWSEQAKKWICKDIFSPQSVFHCLHKDALIICLCVVCSREFILCDVTVWIELLFVHFGIVTLTLHVSWGSKQCSQKTCTTYL